jgi:hypothetical protein
MYTSDKRGLVDGGGGFLGGESDGHEEERL